MEYGYKLTRRGEALQAACLDNGLPLRITRAAVGSGALPQGGRPEEQEGLLHYVSDAAVIDRRHQDNQLFLTVQFSPQEHPQAGDFVLREIMVYAQDPESGAEIGFLYASLGNFAQPVPAYSASAFGGVWSFPMVLAVSGGLQVDITASPGLVTSLDLQDAVDALTLAIMTNELALPLETAEGQALLTNAGAPVLAVYRPDKSAALLERMAAVAGGLEEQIAQSSAGAQAQAQAYADRRVAALEGADRLLEAEIAKTSAEAEAQIAQAKQEAIAAAEADTEAQVQAAKEWVSTSTTAYVQGVAAEVSEYAEQKIAEHDADINSHPRFVAVSDEHDDVAYAPPPHDYS